MYVIRQLRTFLFILLFISLPGILTVPTATAAFRYLHVGMNMPEVEGVNLYDGKKISSQVYQTEENLLIVVFWASWSERSMEELEALKEIATRFSDKPLKIIAVNVDNAVLTKKKRAEIETLVKNLALPFPVIIDNNLELFYKFGVIAVPSTAITDSSGIIKFGPAGYSLTTRDLIVDSIMVMLGLKEPDAERPLKKGYTPDNKASRYYNLALKLHLQGLTQRALSNVMTAIDADANFPAPYNLRGDILLTIDSLESAAIAYQTAVELDTEFVAARSGLGEAWFMLKRYDDAIAQLESLLVYDNTYTPAIVSLSHCYTAIDNADKGLSLLEQARELNPNDVRLLFAIGEWYRDQSEPVKAAEYYRQALQILFPFD